MKIFNSVEEAEFDSPPKFSSAERKQFFTLSAAFKDLLASPRTTPTNKVCFLVSLGYFKARRQFFARQFNPTDIEFVAHQVEVNPLAVRVENYSRETYTRHQRLILRHFSYRAFDALARDFIRHEIQILVRVHNCFYRLSNLQTNRYFD